MSFAGSLAWTVTFTLIGVAAGQAAEQLLGKLERVEGVVMALFAAAAVVGGVWWWRRRVRRAERRAAALRPVAPAASQSASQSASAAAPTLPDGQPPSGP
jgi:cytoskeletal protein RodZ